MPRSVGPVLGRASVHKAVIVMLAALLGLCALSWQGTSEHQASASSPAGLPTGLRLVGNLDRLPDLRNGVFAGQVSTHDKTGLGDDKRHQPDDGTESYLYREGDSYVIFDQKGPGAVTRIWFFWGPPGISYGHVRILFYVDGETEPTVDLSLSELFSGDVSPFVHPLVGHDGQSSGGYYSYVPIPFQDSLKIATSDLPAYYNIGFETYDPDTPVIPFTGREDYTRVLSLMESAGSDPKSTGGNLMESGTLSIPPGSEVTMFQRAGPGVISSIRLQIPQIVPAPVQNDLWDEGRVINGGRSEFTVRIDPENAGVRLTRRLDYATGDQAAEVYVDGSLVGEWNDPGSDATDRWRDSSFEIPESFTADKSELRIAVRDVLGGSYWTEFWYWAHSNVGGEFAMTDSLDVGNPSSEASHQYEVVLQISAPWFGSTYPPIAGDAQAQQASRDLLMETRIVGYWDGEASASVDAPLGAFFGSWSGAAEVKALMMGMEPGGWYYSYFPMPFASGASLKIRNDSSVPIQGLSYEIAYSPEPYPGLGETAGYFQATANQELPTTTGEDYELLDVTGSGHVVGSVLLTRSLPTAPAWWRMGHWEGDERIHIDGSSSPALYGTGTEDYFNAAVYFMGGVFSLPTHGNPLRLLPVVEGTTTIETGAYRLHLFDPISFRSSLRFGLEHGDSDYTWNADYYSLVFWYGLSEPQAALTDTLDVGNVGSEEGHAYSAQGASETAVGAYYYEGDNDDVSVADDGHTATGPVEFDVAIAPDNGGVVLRRRADQSIRNQEALVSVDSEQIGIWYDPGRNTSKRWLDSEFVLPRSATYGKSSVHIKLEPQSGVPWSAYTYWAYTLAPLTGDKFTQDTDADTLADGFDPDDDNDGCIDLRELGSDPGMGGQRDPLSFWDFMDVPTGSALDRDKVIVIADISAVVARFGAQDAGPGTFDRNSDPLSTPNQVSGDTRKNYHPAYDRGASKGPYSWNRLAPDGAIVIQDIGTTVAQFGHSCA